jgi:hypothetical protein
MQNLNQAHKDVVKDLLDLCEKDKITFQFRIRDDGTVSFTYKDDVTKRMYNVFLSSGSRTPALASRSNDEKIPQTVIVGIEVFNLYQWLLINQRKNEAKEEIVDNDIAFDSLVSDLSDLVNRLS